MFGGLIFKKRGMNIKKLILLTFLLSLFLFPAVYAHLDRGKDKIIVGHKVRLAFNLTNDTAKEVIESKNFWKRISSLQQIVFAGTSHSESDEHKLNPVSIGTVVWREWKNAYPDSEVLSQETGFSRPYGRDPYGSYYEDSFIMFPVENKDDRIHPKTVVFGINVNGVYKAYKEDDLKKSKTIEDTVNGIKIRVERDDAGIVKIINLDTGEEIIKERDFCW